MQFISQEALQIAIVVLIIETALILSLVGGWYFGARILNLKLHHWIVYPVIAVHLANVVIWMIPREFEAASHGLYADILGNLILIVHASLGIVVVILSVILVIIFLFNPGMPLKILRRTTPLMIITFIMWIVVFALGLTVFFQFYGG